MSDHFRSLTPSALPFPGWSGAGRPTGRSRRGPKPGLRLLALLCLSSVFGGCGPGGAPASVEERAARLFDEGRVEQARRILEAELAENPTHAPAHLQLARILLAEGSADGAEAHLRTATESAPESVEVWTALGIFLLGAERTADAVTALERAIRLDETYPIARTTYGQVLEEGGFTADARTHYEAARRQDPGTPLHWLLEARILWKLYKPELARTALAAARSKAARPLTPAEEKLAWEVNDDLEVWPEGPPYNAPPPADEAGSAPPPGDDGVDPLRGETPDPTGASEPSREKPQSR